MILTHEEAKRLRDDYMADPFELIREVEEAVLNKLSQGVEMPEPVGYLDGQGDSYTADQLRTVAAAARVKALEDAAVLCDDLYEETGRDHEYGGCIDACRRIRALKGAA